MKLATTTGDYGKYDNTQVVALEHIKKAGFKYADYNFGKDYAHKNGVYSEDYKKYIDEFPSEVERIGIKLIQAHAPMGKPLADDDGVFLQDTLRCVEACGKWGIPNLVVHSGYLPNISREENFELNKKFFMALLERAEEYGVNILVENFNKMYKEGVYWVDNATDLLEMIELVNHPLFHAVFDVGHANLQPMKQSDEIAILGKHLYALHIHDNNGLKDRHMPLYTGTIDIDDVMKGLLDIGYNGYFTFEVGNAIFPEGEKEKYINSDNCDEEKIEYQDAFENYLYSVGKSILEKHNCFEE